MFKLMDKIWQKSICQRFVNRLCLQFLLSDNLVECCNSHSIFLTRRYDPISAWDIYIDNIMKLMSHFPFIDVKHKCCCNWLTSHRVKAQCFPPHSLTKAIQRFQFQVHRFATQQKKGVVLSYLRSWKRLPLY